VKKRNEKCQDALTITGNGGENKKMIRAKNIVFKGEPQKLKSFIEQQVKLCQEALLTAENEAERQDIAELIAFWLKALP
jgi:hypothetical protein